MLGGLFITQRTFLVIVFCLYCKFQGHDEIWVKYSKYNNKKYFNLISIRHDTLLDDFYWNTTFSTNFYMQEYFLFSNFKCAKSLQIGMKRNFCYS